MPPKTTKTSDPQFTRHIPSFLKSHASLLTINKKSYLAGDQLPGDDNDEDDDLRIEAEKEAILEHKKKELLEAEDEDGGATTALEEESRPFSLRVNDPLKHSDSEELEEIPVGSKVLFNRNAAKEKPSQASDAIQAPVAKKAKRSVLSFTEEDG